MKEEPLLLVKDLNVVFRYPGKEITAARGVSFAVGRNETLVMAGESGSGKSVTALSVCGLLPEQSAFVSGSARFDGAELIGMPQKRLRSFRGRRIAYIFQEPASYLNPVYTIGEQIAEVIRLHRGAVRAAAWKEAEHLLELSGISCPQRAARSYPHQLSGGMNQRAAISMALACRPELLIADEPTTSLDMTTEAEIIKLLTRLKKELGFSLLFITHNLAIAERIADQVAVMFRGELVEYRMKEELFASPEHAHTKELLAAYEKVGRFIEG
ncbi:MAG: ABC transporter ATP-binding protein [Candidatus Omnitrophota bacterium]